ncbi:sulfite exporter TauE/SafE family protein [Clostridium sp. P21]|uniref:Sulfite exporter TauE/SafE family protein n=1 Tax=Clostridium muellerianum TaxID=2716538 RepID=A0A7Y0EE15_9CLOT|nr:sulfite exporter TauE/SafE family protein [Clostridium muellerianum]NMM61781.1 sulfite exporter TauE/SafE family protein [Clostridium muellerianum]
MFKGFILGLSSGGYCLASCIPVFVPYILSENKKTKWNFICLSKFMLGRLLGYILFALLAWITGNFIIKQSYYKEIIFSLSYIFLSFILIIYTFSKSHRACNIKYFSKIFNHSNRRNSFATVLLLGFLTGINVCPPFILAFSDAAFFSNIISSILYFIAFFIGTTIYFIPIPFIGILKGKQIKFIGQMCSLIIGIFYMYSGIIMLFKEMMLK